MIQKDKKNVTYDEANIHTLSRVLIVNKFPFIYFTGKETYCEH